MVIVVIEEWELGSKTLKQALEMIQDLNDNYDYECHIEGCGDGKRRYVFEGGVNGNPTNL